MHHPPFLPNKKQITYIPSLHQPHKSFTQYHKHKQTTWNTKHIPSINKESAFSAYINSSCPELTRRFTVSWIASLWSLHHRWKNACNIHIKLINGSIFLWCLFDLKSQNAQFRILNLFNIDEFPILVNQQRLNHGIKNVLDACPL